MKKQRMSGGGKVAAPVEVPSLAYVPFERTPTGGVPCPWCKKECDAGFRLPVIAKPCLHVGCMDCVRRAVAPASMGSHKLAMCPVCSKIVRTFTIEGAPISRVVVAVADEEKKEKEQASSKGKEEAAQDKEEKEAEEGGVMAMELEELKQLRGTEPDETWVCIVCAFNYDNATRLPVCVSECYAIAADPHMPKLDRGLAPGCGHNICEQCMLELFAKGDPTCYTCRAFIKNFGINVPLLRKIAAFKDGYYLSLVLQLNDSAKKQHEMTMSVRKREEEFKRFDELKAKASKLEKERDAAEKARQTAEQGLSNYLAKYNAAHARANTLDQQCAKATERLRAAMGINKMLYDEVIAMRLQAMEAGLQARSQLGLEVDEEQSPDKIVLKVLARDRKTTMYYGRLWKGLSSEERGAIDRIRTHNKREREGEAGELASLPTDDEIEQSHKTMASGQPLVRVGSWLHERIMSKVNTVEATFDAPPGGGGGMVEEMAMYCAVSSEALVSAMSAYERLRKEARSRPAPDADVNPNAPDVTIGEGRDDMCASCRLFFACGDTKINCNHLVAFEEPGQPRTAVWFSREKKERLAVLYSVDGEGGPSPPLRELAGIRESDLPAPPPYQPDGRERQILEELLTLPIGAAVKTLRDNSALLDWLSNASNYRRLLTGKQRGDINMLVRVAKHPLTRAGDLKGAVGAVFPNLMDETAHVHFGEGGGGVAREVSDFAADFLPSHASAASPDELARAVAIARTQGEDAGVRDARAAAAVVRPDVTGPSLLGVAASVRRHVAQRLGAAIAQRERGDNGAQPEGRDLQSPVRNWGALQQRDAEEDDVRIEETNNNDANRAPESMFDL